MGLANGTCQVLFYSGDGPGAAEYVTVNEGTTLDRLLQDKIYGFNPDKFTILYNREQLNVNPNTVTLSHKDRVSVLPKKVAGALRA